MSAFKRLVGELGLPREAVAYQIRHGAASEAMLNGRMALIEVQARLDCEPADAVHSSAVEGVSGADTVGRPSDDKFITEAPDGTMALGRGDHHRGFG